MYDATILPPNATTTEVALDEAGARILNVPVLIRDMQNPDEAPAAVLPWLAWGNSVDTWDSNWTEEQKRAAIKTSLDVHKYKGTIAALREALTALGYGLTIIEWFQMQPEGEPYTFKVIITVEESVASSDTMSRILSLINRTKNLRSHMIELQVIIKASDRLNIAGVSGIGSEITILD